MTASKHPLEPGTVLVGKYRVERLVGQGAVAAVYRARHEVLQQDVAIKLLLPEVAERPEVTSRFLNEARAAASLRNEHVASVMDVGTAEDGTPFIVLEYLDGRDLQAVLDERGPLPWKEVVDWALQALEAVAHAHAASIIHRDLKPSNLFLARKHDGTAIIKVLDFGLSKIKNGLQGAVATATTTSLGSPAFTSPEQLRSAKSVDVRADVWSVGAVVFYLVTGKYPFEGGSEGELFAAILEHAPATIRSSKPDVPEELDRVVAKCLSKKLDERYANVAELAQALGPLATPQGRQSVDRVCRTLGVAPPPPAPAAAPLIAIGNKSSGAAALTETTMAEAPRPTPPLAATMPKPIEAPTMEPLAAPRPAGPPKPANQAMIRTVAGAAKRRETLGVLVVLGLAAVISVAFYAWNHGRSASAAAPPEPKADVGPSETARAAPSPPPPEPVPSTAPAAAPSSTLATAIPVAASASAARPRHARPAKSKDLMTNPLLLQRN